MDPREHDELETQELMEERRIAEALEAMAKALHRIAIALEIED